MATPPPSAEQHRAGQAALVSLIPALIARAWPVLDVHDLSGTRAQFQAVIEAITVRYGQAAAVAAAAYYRKARAAADVAVPAPTLLVPPVPAHAVDDAVGYGLSSLYGPVTEPGQVEAMDQVSASVEQLVLDQGREQIIDAVRQDRRAKGWVRVTEPGACSFCTMLALRAGAGFLYKDEQSAGRRANRRFKGGGFSFKVHDNCRCHAEPVFTAYEPSARMREAEKTWRDATRGKSGKAAQKAFRQTWEGRKVTDGGPRSVPLAQDPDRIRRQITLTEGLKPSPWRAGQLARLQKMLDDLP